MKLAKPTAPTKDARYAIEQRTYLAHCENISRIISAAVGQKATVRQELIDLYLTSVNTETEE